MRYRVIVAGLLVAGAARTAQAQCPTATVDACQKAVDVLNYMTPQLSTALASGNPTLGQGGTLGGLGHFSIDLRASAVNGSVPKTNNLSLSTSGKQNSTFTNDNKLVPAASLDAGIGLWRGYSLGITHIGGVDAIVTMTYLPTLKSNNNCNVSSCGGGSGDFTVQGSNEKFGYGIRLGVLEESAVTPGVSIAWVQRDLPTVSFTGTVDSTGITNPGGTLALNNFSVKTTALRITAAKSFLIFGLSLGIGQDKYDANSTITATVNGPFGGTGSQPASFSMTRTNMFVGAYMNLFLFKLEGEYGQVTGGNATTFNTFSPTANASRSYFTLGLRFGR